MPGGRNGAVVGGGGRGRQRVAVSGRQIVMPGYSGVDADALFAAYSADVVTLVFDAILIQ